MIKKSTNKPKISERDVVTQIKDGLSALGIYHWRNNTGFHSLSYKGENRFVRYGKKGLPDILGVLPGGKFLGIECKAPGGKLSADQEFVINEIHNLGGVAFMATSWEDVETVLHREYAI